MRIRDLLEAIAQEHQPVTESEKKCAITRGEHNSIRRKFKMKTAKHFITAFQSELARLENEK